MTADQEQTSKCIRREVAKLSDKWSALLTQLDLWQRRLDDTLPVRKENPMMMPAISPLYLQSFKELVDLESIKPCLN